MEKVVLTYRSLTCTLFRSLLAFQTLPCPRPAAHRPPPPDVRQRARQDSLLDCVPAIALSIPFCRFHHIPRDTTTPARRKKETRRKRDKQREQGKRTGEKRLQQKQTEDRKNLQTFVGVEIRNRIVREFLLDRLEFIFLHTRPPSILWLLAPVSGSKYIPRQKIRNEPGPHPLRF
jgi:hypothetical protein